MMSNSKLLLNWKEPITNKNYIVGILQKKLDQYVFKYNQSELSEAKKEGFTLLVGFNKIEEIYRSDKLFSVFERRLPSSSRQVFKRFVEENDLTKSIDINWDYLSRTKGRLATDSLSFIVPIQYDGEQVRFYCEVAGWSYTEETNSNFKKMNALIVNKDEMNPKDPCAVEILDTANENVRVGYIPRPFNQVFHRIISRKVEVFAKTYHLNEEDQRPNILVFSAELPKGFFEQEKDIHYMIEFTAQAQSDSDRNGGHRYWN